VLDDDGKPVEINMPQPARDTDANPIIIDIQAEPKGIPINEGANEPPAEN